MSDDSHVSEPPTNEFGCYDCEIIAGESYVMDDFMGLMSLVFLGVLAIITLFFFRDRFLPAIRRRLDAEDKSE
ncbi:hypothetical protein [Altererythrobacter lutimaris]|uniref:Uncharacterized protein n=1 Tax=Altererythrobacter lutimaris TaxID=2743979 RepID=A0A850H3R1_9SPHN|nr:hypothetical protein [Altererythrobacter lutimaris]NVE93814.1 hypothetical protein [Altererythrobacter lutimaris]